MVTQRYQLLGIEEDEVLRRLFEAGGVRHDLSQGGRLAVPQGHAEIEVLVDVLVEIELALLHQLHDRRPGEQLRHRARTKQRAFRVDALALLDIGIAEATLGEHSAVSDHDHDGAGDVAGLPRIGHEAIEPDVEICLVQRMAARCRRRGVVIARRCIALWRHRARLLGGPRRGNDHAERSREQLE